MQQGEDPQRAACGDQVEVGHAASKQRMSLAKVVMNIQTAHHCSQAAARLVAHQELGDGVAQGLRAFIRAAQRHMRHGGAQYAGGNRVTLGVVGIQQAVR